MLDKLRKRLRSEKGFTLIELLVVMIILAILTAIAIPSYLSFRDRANKSAAAADLRAAIPSVEAFFAAQGFTLRRIPTVWRFPGRATRDAVLRIEFSRDVAERAIAATTGLEIPVGYRLHVRRAGLVTRA